MSHCSRCLAELDPKALTCPACGQTALIPYIPELDKHISSSPGTEAEQPENDLSAVDAKWAKHGVVVARQGWKCTVDGHDPAVPAIREQTGTPKGWCAEHWPPPAGFKPKKRGGEK